MAVVDVDCLSRYKQQTIQIELHGVSEKSSTSYFAEHFRAGLTDRLQKFQQLQSQR